MSVKMDNISVCNPSKIERGDCSDEDPQRQLVESVQQLGTPIHLKTRESGCSNIEEVIKTQQRATSGSMIATIVTVMNMDSHWRIQGRTN